MTTIRFIAIALALLPSVDTSAQQFVRVPDGTSVHIQLKKELSSQRTHNGDVVQFEVAEPVVIDNIVVILQGATATAAILNSRSAGHWGRKGRLAWAMQSVAAADGTQIPLRFIKEIPRGGAGANKPTKKSRAAGAAEITAMSPIIFYYSPALVVVVPFVAASKGKPEVIPAGERYLAFVNGDAQMPAAANSVK